MKEFLNERVNTKTKSLSDRVPLTKRGNFSTQKLKKGDTENRKEDIEEMQSKAFASVLRLIETSDAIKMEDALQYRVTDECPSILNAMEAYARHRKASCSKN